ncbi:serine/threonine-protein kinase PINK1-like protein [Leptotrombidium deliense]|uniref:non-specific serine/threonine protein kinase n=1 Tax=Leptotrombidium deliense TaxID=299467 RepID=A0A443RVM1_9ACAR|nr:serine/threonine-protein kinase PINK1-like protein [Leptotrombidium deliense]
MTLFLVMKKFDMSLKEFLNEEKLSTQTSLLLLYQLFEAVSHLVKQKVSHRDIKTDNILVDISKGIEYPWLTLTDFGTCCTSLRLPFTSHDVCRGGNLALMAPEVVTAEPGPFASIDYSMADLWSSATIAYEIFNGKNPFYPQQGYKCLQSSRYDENQLPDLPKTAPKPISLLIKNILRRNPSCRPNPKECASMCAMLLFCSKRCLQSLQTISHCSDSIKSQKLLQWLRTLSATTFCQRNTILGGKRLNAVEIKARLMFLSDVKIENLLPNFKYL